MIMKKRIYIQPEIEVEMCCTKYALMDLLGSGSAPQPGTNTNTNPAPGRTEVPNSPHL